MQSMKGATSLLGSMNRQMNLPALQRIAMEFEKENDIMDQRQEMMDDAIDDVTGLEDEEEGEEVVKEVLDEIGVDLGQAVGSLLIGRSAPTQDILSSPVRILMLTTSNRWVRRHPVFRRVLYPKEKLQRLLAVEALMTMMICKQGWIVYANNAITHERPKLDTDNDITKVMTDQLHRWIPYKHLWAEEMTR